VVEVYAVARAVYAIDWEGLRDMAQTAFSFIATIAPLQTAITISSDGGIRVKLDIPENQEGAALELLTMRGKVLKVTIEEAGQNDDGTEKQRKIHI